MTQAGMSPIVAVPSGTSRVLLQTGYAKGSSGHMVSVASATNVLSWGYTMAEQRRIRN